MACVGRCCTNFCREFQDFALRRYVVDLAIAIIIGTVFVNVIQSLVDDIVTPPLGLVLGGVDFANLTIKMKNFVYQDQPPVVIRYGKFIQTMIVFFIMAITLFFFIKGINKLNQVTDKNKENKTTNDVVKMLNEDEILC